MDETRRFLSTAIASGLDFEMMTPEDVIRHISMDVLAHHLPVALKVRLLTAALESEVMNAMLVLDTLGIDALAEHVPANLLWDCVATAAVRSLGEENAPSAPIVATKTQPTATAPVVKAPSREKAELPLSPATNTSPVAARKPNRSARPSRVRAGATSRGGTMPPPQAPAPIPDEDDSAFDVDTRVGGDPSLSGLDSLDDIENASDEVTKYGQKF